ncbi:MAG: COX15/CtaA family protein [Alphaproteobacteria bacterium]|nr:COX15/CtaA family protein [Alphaproteobacteria bacterium]
MISQSSIPARKALTVWLTTCCILILCMAVIGAITRLTESGLSITKWEPIKGTLPPLNAAAWNEAYELYKATPQYAGIHDGMSLEEFKGIYFWEWIHRLWGRMIGVVFALPLLFFWVKGMIPKSFKLPLLGIFLLGGFQGFIGWFMVQSGLEPGQVSVSPIRLALHLGIALLIYALTFWQILRLHPEQFRLHRPYTWCLHRHTLFALLFLSITIVWGAFTAGLDAGKIYNSFPLMDGRLVPTDFIAFEDWLKNITANPAAVQFIHRVLATITFVLTVTLAWRMHSIDKRLSIALSGFMILQYCLGIATILTGAHIIPASLHQANAVLALTSLIAALFVVKQKV